MVVFVGRGLLGADRSHEAKMVSLELQSIPGGHLDNNIRKYRSYMGQKEFGRNGGFRREVLLGADGPHEAKMVSLEPQSIPGGHLDINI